MRVYRIEQPETGCGPYRSPGRHIEVVEATDSHFGPRWPTPDNDGLYCTEEEHRFGAPTKRALQRWFADCWDVLARHGFEVVAYEVPEAEVAFSDSGRQCRWYAYRARRVDSWPVPPSTELTLFDVA